MSCSCSLGCCGKNVHKLIKQNMTEQITTLTKITNDPSTGLGSSSAKTIKVRFLRDYGTVKTMNMDKQLFHQSVQILRRMVQSR